MGARSLSTNSRRAVTVAVLGIAVLSLAACVSSAPPLPQDTTGTTSKHPVSAADFAASDLALTCAQIGHDRAELQAQLDKANANIASDRTGNQVAAFAGGLITPLAYLATEGNYADKDAVKAAYLRLDVLNKLAVLKHC